jgi:hypothetical protein
MSSTKNKYFDGFNGPPKREIKGPAFDCLPEDILLCVFEHADGESLIIRHKQNLNPRFLVELGDMIMKMGRRLQQ